MNVGERFDKEEKELTDASIVLSRVTTDDLEEKIKHLIENQDILIESHNFLVHNQKILQDERDEFARKLLQLQREVNELKNKNKSKKIKYGLIGILSFATVFSAIVLPDFVKLLSIGFVCPLVNQLYYLFRDR